MRGRERNGCHRVIEIRLVERNGVMLRVSELFDGVTRSCESDDVVRGSVPVPGCVRPVQDELGDSVRDLRNLLSRSEGGIDDDMESSVAERQLVLGHVLSVAHGYDIDARLAARSAQ